MIVLLVPQCRLVERGLVLIVVVVLVLDLLVDDASHDLASSQVVGVRTMDRAVAPTLFPVLHFEAPAC